MISSPASCAARCSRSWPIRCHPSAASCSSPRRLMRTVVYDNLTTPRAQAPPHRGRRSPPESVFPDDGAEIAEVIAEHLRPGPRRRPERRRRVRAAIAGGRRPSSAPAAGQRTSARPRRPSSPTGVRWGSSMIPPSRPSSCTELGERLGSPACTDDAIELLEQARGGLPGPRRGQRSQDLCQRALHRADAQRPSRRGRGLAAIRGRRGRARRRRPWQQHPAFAMRAARRARRGDRR